MAQDSAEPGSRPAPASRQADARRRSRPGVGRAHPCLQPRRRAEHGGVRARARGARGGAGRRRVVGRGRGVRCRCARRCRAGARRPVATARGVDEPVPQRRPGVAAAGPRAGHDRAPRARCRHGAVARCAGRRPLRHAWPSPTGVAACRPTRWSGCSSRSSPRARTRAAPASGWRWCTASSAKPAAPSTCRTRRGRGLLHAVPAGERVADACHAGAPDAMPHGQGQRIAVVDDEPALAQLAQETLQALGYQVHAFTDPVAALEAVRTAQPPFDAVVTDEVMPALTGTQLIEALRPTSRTCRCCWSAATAARCWPRVRQRQERAACCPSRCAAPNWPMRCESPCAEPCLSRRPDANQGHWVAAAPLRTMRPWHNDSPFAGRRPRWRPRLHPWRRNQRPRRIPQPRRATRSPGRSTRTHLKPRGGTTRGAPVTLDREPSAGWRALQERGLSARERDRRAILAMAGTYRVTFDFLEIAAYCAARQADRAVPVVGHREGLRRPGPAGVRQPGAHPRDAHGRQGRRGRRADGHQALAPGLGLRAGADRRVQGSRPLAAPRA